MNYCGIDLASRTTALCIVDADDKVLAELSITTDRQSLQTALKRFPALHAVVEAAPLAEWCKREMNALGYHCDIIDTRAAQGMFRARKKTDRHDARTLAKMARTGWYSPVHAKSSEARQARTQLSVRSGLMSIRISLHNQVLGLLRANALVVKKSEKGVRFADKIRALLTEQPVLLAVLEPLLSAWSHVQTQLYQIDRGLHRAAKSTSETQRLMQVPGIGKLTALAFVATMDDPTRFKNAKQVGDYFGLAPGIYQSGDTEVRGRITRQGDRLVRTLLVEAANTVLYHYRGKWSLKSWALRLKEKKGAGKARVALARKLAILLWTLWKNESVFVAQAA